MGPAMRSASARSASASMRTTFSPIVFMQEEKMLARAAVETLLATSRSGQRRCTQRLYEPLEASEVLVHLVLRRCAWLPQHDKALGLNGPVPRPRFPVVFLLFRMNPRRQGDQQSPGDGLRVGLVLRTQVSKLFFTLRPFFQLHAALGQGFPQTRQFFGRQSISVH